MTNRGGVHVICTLPYLFFGNSNSKYGATNVAFG